MKIIHECIKDMETKGIFQWNQYYPDIEVIIEDIEKRTLYLIKKEDEYQGIITLDKDQPTEYTKIPWLSPTGRNLIIHRLAVHPKWQGKGIAMKLMDFAEEYASKNNYVSVRLDAFTANPNSNRLYEKRGYKIVGQIYIPMRELPFHCYEKLI
ncbi:MAG: GNAT family N-acetyltransferase [Bacteroidaceae bacterium]|nr:GNAT family N-acetyltransferase [Bacteroidaceae bacterium]